jgi:hypothetical protein
VLRTGAPWGDVPDRYPSYQTCHRRFQQWVRSGVMKEIVETLATNLKARGALDVREAFIEASFAPAKKGAPRLERPSAAKELRSWQWQIAMACQWPSAWKSATRRVSKSIQDDATLQPSSTYTEPVPHVFQRDALGLREDKQHDEELSYHHDREKCGRHGGGMSAEQGKIHESTAVMNQCVKLPRLCPFALTALGKISLM